ncbi:MAG TPA: DUF5916 domain-containing protein [Thermoanaerobaculia bacterium]|jgi:hypothetical protein
MRRAVVLALFLLALQASAIPAKRLTGGPIVLDGDPSEAAWEGAQRVDDFVEYYRGDNVPEVAPTTAWVGYDDEFLYVAFRNEDPRAVEMRAPLVDRDKVLGDQDYVAVLLDTQNDRRSAVVFRVNPRGVQADSVVNDATGEEDFSPDFFYDAVAQRTPDGWSAELRIPLSSLRYPASSPQTWGVILMRNYPRDHRYVMAQTRIPKNGGCFVCNAERFEGLTALPAGSHMRLTPYSTASLKQQSAGTRIGALTPRRFGSDLGLDLKWSPSTALTIDGTINPDFSQIESDIPESTVGSRVALQLEEKRPFFLESVDLLDTPIWAVQTRSITSPSWGVRATGQSGSSAYTLLMAEDRGGATMILPSPTGSTTVRQDFRSRVAIGRLRHTFGDSFAGALVSTREIEGGGHNRLFGPDFFWKLNDRDKFSGQLLLSDTENPDRPELHPRFDGRSDSGRASRFVLHRESRGYDLWGMVSEYSPGFRADNGFIVLNGLRRGAFWVGLRNNPKSFFSYVRPYAGTEHDLLWESGAHQRVGLYLGVEYRGRFGLEGWSSLASDRERVGTSLLRRDFVRFDTRIVPTRWLPQLRLQGHVGQKIDYAGARVGNGALLNLTTIFRPTDHLELSMRNSREWLDLEGSRLFQSNIDWLKATYNFTARSLARVIAQQSDVERNEVQQNRKLSFSALYGYKLNWQTVFFVGYGDASIENDQQVITEQARSLFMKVAYAFQR